MVRTALMTLVLGGVFPLHIEAQEPRFQVDALGQAQIDASEVRSRIESCIPEGALFEPAVQADGTVVGAPNPTNGMIRIVVTRRGLLVTTARLRAGECLRRAFRDAPVEGVPGAAVDLWISRRGWPGRTDPYYRTEGAGFVLVFETPSLLELVLREAVSECAGEVDSTRTFTFSMHGYRVRVRRAPARFTRCANRALAEQRIDDSMDAFTARGQIVLVPLELARRR